MAGRALLRAAAGHGMPHVGGPETSVVIVTRNRRDSLLDTLDRLQQLPETLPILVVDNGSTDGTPSTVRRRHPEVAMIEARANLGAAGRNLGVQAASTPYVAFSDDDSWWAPGSLGAAADAFNRHEHLGLVAGRILVGPREQDDPVCERMASSPISDTAAPGRPVLGFVACGAVVRKKAFLAAGGFKSQFGVGGEETLLAMDLRTLGWQTAYLVEVVAHHHPSPIRDNAARRRRQIRNSLWTTWLRLPAIDIIRDTLVGVRRTFTDRDARRGLADAVSGLPWVIRDRRVLPASVVREWRLVYRSVGGEPDF